MMMNSVLCCDPFAIEQKKKRDSNLFSTYSIPNNLEWDESKRIQKWEGTHHVMYFEIKNKKKAIHIVLVAYIPQCWDEIEDVCDEKRKKRCGGIPIRYRAMCFGHPDSAWVLSSRSIERSILFFSFFLSFCLSFPLVYVLYLLHVL